MKYLGPISDPKDMVNKEYVDNNASGVTDVLANGVSVVDDGVAIIPVAKLSTKYGLVKPEEGMTIDDNYDFIYLAYENIYGAETFERLATITLATTSTRGLMSSTDKTKLDGIETEAEVNQNTFSNVKVGSTTIQADSKTDTIELVAGNNITLTPDSTNDKVTINASSGGDHVELTQAEYNALSQAEKENGTVYFITDGTPDYTVINDSVPIGAVQAYAGAALPYGWLFCDGSAVSRETYSELFTAIGTAYGPGDGSTTFNLPDLRGRVITGVGLADGVTYAIGDKIDAGVPNITGGFAPWSEGAGTNITQPTGAFYHEASNQYGWGTTTGRDQDNAYMRFDASISNAHYGKSSTVQPNTTVANYIIKALNTVSSSVLEELDPQSIIFDLFYPVGSYYETSDATFDPNIQWRGTWVSNSAIFTEDVGYEVINTTIGLNRGSNVAINAPVKTDYTFVHWSHVATNGWVGSCYVEYPQNASTRIWNSYSGGATSGTGTVYVLAIYKKNKTINRWHRTA